MEAVAGFQQCCRSYLLPRLLERNGLSRQSAISDQGRSASNETSPTVCPVLDTILILEAYTCITIFPGFSGGEPQVELSMLTAFGYLDPLDHVEVSIKRKPADPNQFQSSFSRAFFA